MTESVRPEPEQSARQAGLRYVNDGMPGIRREPRDEGFAYIGPDGEGLDDEAELKRIAALAIPPAWTEVWICPNPKGHLLATGRDEKGRKQYRYHPRWRQARNATKFHRMVVFGAALPALRARVDKELRRQGLPREKVLATVVALLEATLIRVGNREYARSNQHYGLTTLRDKHVEVSGTTVHFEFTGKSGKQHAVDLSDRRLARVVKACRDLPGYDLFQYLDEDGQRHRIGSGEVNDFLREVTGEDFTAKDFRTWAGTVLAIATLQACQPCEDDAQRKQNVVQVVDTVAEQLGNTRTVCRNYYIHPHVLDCYLDGTLAGLLEGEVEALEGLHPEECTMLALLHRLEEGADAP